MILEIPNIKINPIFITGLVIEFTPYIHLYPKMVLQLVNVFPKTWKCFMKIPDSLLEIVRVTKGYLEAPFLDKRGYRG